jgi:hypothetical protein
MGEALVGVVQGFGEDVAMALMMDFLKALPFKEHADLVLEYLDVVAAADPALAQRGFIKVVEAQPLPRNLNLDGRPWITSLPEGMRVLGNLEVSGTGLTEVPKGIDVGGYLDLSVTQVGALPDNLVLTHSLNLHFCPIKTLPAGLVVGRNLTLLDCEQWDGWIPADTVVKDFLFTDEHPDGLILAEWRSRHPHGEPRP